MLRADTEVYLGATCHDGPHFEGGCLRYVASGMCVELSNKWKDKTNALAVNPDLKHPYYIRNRQKSWEERGILEPDGSGPLRWETYDAKLTAQGRRCGLCGRSEFWCPRLCADHDHLTHRFRGVLCRDCNQFAVGVFEKTGHYRTPEHEAAIRAYLERA
jgi:hypothetical protein